MTHPVTILELDRASRAPRVSLDRQPCVLPDARARLQKVIPASCIHDAFVDQAAQAPEKLALCSAFGCCTYGDLEAISRGIARSLAARGIGAGATVAILADRGPALVYCLLGVLRAGAAFQIVDVAYPIPRMQACLEQTTPTLLLIAGALTGWEGSPAVLGFDMTRCIHVPADHTAAKGRFADAEQGTSLPRVDPDQAAYVSFTSGSTGKPKAIVTDHSPLVHFVCFQARHGALTASDRFAMVAGLGHDPLLRDVFTPLSLGATLYVPEQTTIFDADALWRWFSESAITIAHLTPAIGEIVAAGAPPGAQLPQLRRIYWGGDRLSTQLLDRVRACAPNVLHTNCYGATETPQVVAYHDLTVWSDGAELPIGQGIDAAQLLVIDACGAPCGVGEEGEIWVRSPYLARGYLGDEAQTHARFVPNPLTGDPSDRCYRTGDRGYYRPDGAVMYVGRADQQVKIRGFRVEPAEVARALERQPAVERAVVLGTTARGEVQLIAHVVLRAGQLASERALRRAVARELPSYMVPQHVHVLPAFPLLPSGKVDLRALAEPVRSDRQGASTDAKRLPRTDAERALAAVWEELLGVTQIGIDESFLELGGDSLTAIRALARMRRLGIPEAVARGIFQGRTIAEITAGETSDAARPLTGAARTTLLINVLRGALVALLFFDHFREGIFKRLDLPVALTAPFEFIFHLPTPGFAFVFGLGLGYAQYPSFLRNRAASRRLLLGGALLLAAGTVIMGLSRNLGVLARGRTLDLDLFSTNFFLPTLYYCLALATAPVWFAIMARREGKWGGGLLASLLMAAASRAAYELCRLLLLEPERAGLLQLGRLMLVARFSYFNLSTGALLGIGLGLYVRRLGSGVPLARPFGLLGSLGLTIGAVTALSQPERYADGLVSPDIWLPEWLFYLGFAALLGALVDVLMRWSHVVSLRRLFEWVGALGQCAMPVFIAQGMLMDVSAFGRALGLRDAVSVSLALLGFVMLVGWMMRRVHGLYYARGGDPRALSVPLPA